MYKKAFVCLLAMNLFLLLFFVQGGEGSAAFLRGVEEGSRARQKQAVSALGIADLAASGQRIVQWDQVKNPLKYHLESAELEVLWRIVEAEAGTEDEEGKLLVANVVLNRMDSEAFPDTVTDVVFQRAQGITQFSPVSNGRYYAVSVSEETKEAVQRALEGENISGGALYFAARAYADSQRMKWFDENLTFLFEHGGHEFFK